MSSLLNDLPTPLRSTVLMLPWILVLLVADVFLSLLLPLSAFVPTAVYHISSQLAYLVWFGIQSIYTQANGARIQFSQTSAVLPRHESAIVVANHVAWTDFYMIQALAVRAGMLSRCRWFAKNQLKWVPLLGWGLWAMGMPLVTRDWTRDSAEMSRVFGGIRGYGWPIWLIAYSEATRFSPTKHAGTVRWCEENGRTPPKHTLWPRYRGFVATVTQLRLARQVRAVYDVTIAYAGRRNGQWKWMAAPSFSESVSRAGLDQRYKLYVDVQRFELEDLPESPAELRQWLEDRWAVKDLKLEELRAGLERGVWDGQPLR